MHAERREQRELRALRLEESKLEVEKQRIAQDLQNQNRLYNLQVERIDIDKRRLDLDGQRFHMEKEERLAQLEQSEQLTVLLGKLADKIN